MSLKVEVSLLPTLLKAANGHDRDQGRNETVFDRRGADSSLAKREKKLFMMVLRCALSLCSAFD